MRRDEFPLVDKHVKNEINAVLNKIRAEIKAEIPILSHWQTDDGQDLLMVADALECIDKHTGISSIGQQIAYSNH